METILYNFIMLVSRIHTYFLTWNDSIENSFTDKELHFIIVGAFGIGLILVLHPIFLWLSRTGHTMVISFFYVFTVILVLTFAIEIGQGYTGTGVMDFDDAKNGIQGFIAFFIVFLVIRGIIHLIMRAVGARDKGNPRHEEFF
ncbi:MAG: hypothetical protein Q4F96_04265 [Bacillota bacterium]|nr:hypothetical protein [Bacillota bacterium]